VNSQLLKGIVIVALGAACYGMLAVFVKLGRADGFSTGEITFAQNFVGFIGLALLNFSRKLYRPASGKRIPWKVKRQLILGGIPFGLTGSCYYFSLNYASVSVCIVMLMQSVWIGSVVDYFVNKTLPSKNKVIAIFVVLIGTVLATNLLGAEQNLDWRGVFWGFMAAVTYTGSLYVTNNVANNYPPLTRSMYILMGSLCTTLIIWGYSLSQQFDFSVVWRWGLIIALFGTILSPLLFTKGMPIVGIGLGSILASVELPVSVGMAWLILGEKVAFWQWVGIVLIIVAVILMNMSYFKPAKSD
jgi:Permeases of the drug/metabolite transporter (DMT) superfamily